MSHSFSYLCSCTVNLWMSIIWESEWAQIVFVNSGALFLKASRIFAQISNINLLWKSGCGGHGILCYPPVWSCPLFFCAVSFWVPVRLRAQSTDHHLLHIILQYFYYTKVHTKMDWLWDFIISESWFQDRVCYFSILLPIHL